MVEAPELASRGDWEWKREERKLEVIWTTLPETVKACHEILYCGCKKDVEDTVNVSRQHSSTLNFATVVDFALRTNILIILHGILLFREFK